MYLCTSECTYKYFKPLPDECHKFVTSKKKKKIGRPMDSNPRHTDARPTLYPPGHQSQCLQILQKCTYEDFYYTYLKKKSRNFTPSRK